MKLYELFDNEINKTTRPYQSTVNKIASVSEPSGKGHFAKVYKTDSPKRLNQVTKVGKAGSIGYKAPVGTHDINNDGYLSYINMVREFQEAGGYNPFFPVVKKLKIYKEKEGLYYIADIEKLYPLKTSKIIDNKELMSSLKEQWFNTEEFEWMEDANIGSVFLYVFDLPYPDDAIKDQNLKSALKMIDKLRKQGDFSVDMGSENIMWRITGTMPQLVITDPLA